MEWDIYLPIAANDATREVTDPLNESKKECCFLIHE